MDERRKELGLTQQALADRLGVSRASVMRWLHGDVKPSRLARERIRAVLGIEVE